MSIFSLILCCEDANKQPLRQMAFSAKTTLLQR